MQKPSQKLHTQPFEKHILLGLIAIMCLAPLPFGSVGKAPFGVITFFTGLLGIYWGINAAKNNALVRISLSHIKWLALVMCLVLLWAILQIIPFNFGLFGNDFWSMANQLLPKQNIKSSISLNPHESWMGLIKITCYIIFFWLTMQVCRSSNNIKTILVALSFSGAAYACYGLIMQTLDIQKVLWYDKKSYLDSLTSTFINRNSYATYAGIILIISIALFLNKLFENSSGIKKHKFFQTITNRLFTTSLPSLAIVILCAAALVLSASRAGIIASLIGVITFVLLNSFSANMKRNRKIFIGLSLLVIIIFSAIFSTGGDTASRRFGKISNEADTRFAIYRITTEAIKDFPLKGIGLGSFNDVVKAYRDDSLSHKMDTQITYAHNSYLELILELGLPAAIMVFYVFGIILMKCYYGSWSRRQNNYIPAIAASAGTLVFFHSLFDFSIQIPAVAIVIIALLAMGFAQSSSTRIDLSDNSIDIKTSPIWQKIATKTIIAVGIILTLAGIWQFGAGFIGTSGPKYNEIALKKIELARVGGALTQEGQDLLASAENDLKQRLELSPIDSFSWAYLSYIKLLEGDREASAKFFTTSLTNGFYEPRLVYFRIQLIPVLWSAATADEKEIFGNQIKYAWKISYKRTMQTMKSDLARDILKEQLNTLPEAEKELEKFDAIAKLNK